MEGIQSAFSSIKVLILPDDMIEDIKIFREENSLTEVEMKIANNEINKNLNKIDWTNVDNLKKWIE